jgi:hypothetical protein
MPQGIGERCAGFLSSDERYAYCTREEYAGGLDQNEETMPPAYAHLIDGECRCGLSHGARVNGHAPGRTSGPPVLRVSGRATGGLDWFSQHTGLDRTFLASLDDLDEDGDEIVFTFPGLRAEKLRSRDRKGRWRNHEIVPPLWPRPGEEMPERLYITEGESDAATLIAAGYDACGITLGASSKLDDRDVRALHAAGVRELVLVGDADAPGREWVEWHTRTAHLAGLHVARVEFDALVSPFGSDIKDANGLYQACASVDEFCALIDEHTVAIETPSYAVALDDVLAWADEEVEWIIPDLLARGDKAILAAPQKSLKTYLALELMVTCATCTAFLGLAEWKPSKPLRALIVEEEGSRPMFGRRFRRVLNGAGVDVIVAPLVKFRDGFSLMDESEVNALIEYAQKHEIDLIIIDPLQRVIPGVDENDNSKMKFPWDEIHRITQECPRCAVLILAHNRKGDALSFEAIRGAVRQAGEVDLGVFIEKQDDVVRDEAKNTYTGTIAVVFEGREIPSHLSKNEAMEVRYVFDYDLDSFEMQATGGLVVSLRPAAMGEKNKQQVLAYLVDAGEQKAISDIAADTDLSERTAKKHLLALEADGLVEAMRVRGGRTLWGVKA